MAGTELTIGGWFATSIIRNVIDTARSILANNIALGCKTAQNLNKLKSLLPLIETIIEKASKNPIESRGLIEWLDNLRNKAYKVKDVLDDLQAMRFRESLKEKYMVTKYLPLKGKNLKILFLGNKELRAFNSAVDEFYTFAADIGTFIKLWREDRNNENTEHTNTMIRETSSTLEHNKKIFGRDIEIDFILAMILNHLIPFPEEKPNNREEKSYNREEKGNTSVVHNQDIGNIKSTFETGSTSGLKEMSNTESSSSVPEQNNTLLIQDWELPVLPIYGIGGVGKTTIAQMVYNSDIAQDVFGNLRIWVYVSEKPDKMKIMSKIARELGDDRIINSTMDIDTMERNLIVAIKNKRFFLVLDDVYDGFNSIWDGLFNKVLKKGAPGSFVLVTTQSEYVAKIIGNLSNIIKLGVLESEWFGILFKYYAFGKLFKFNWRSGKCSISLTNNNAGAQFLDLSEEDLSVLESIATKIAEKLHGLPLAGEVIGKMLHQELNIKRWEGILKRKWWELDDDISDKILLSISIGYKDLDCELQQCFLFCSIFPKHYEFDRIALVQMWMAHESDFFEPNEKEKIELSKGIIRSLEDVGAKRFDKLVERSFFQATINNDSKYVMHDLIRELAIVLSRKNMFYHFESLVNGIPDMIEHVGINRDGSEGENEIISINTNLRTMMLYSNWENCSYESISSIIAKPKGIRLLNLPKINTTKIVDGFVQHLWSSLVKSDVFILDAICQLSHLRFLDLSFSGIEFIPDTLCELWHLQVLDVRGCAFRKLPKGMNRLINLRHLYASGETVSQISGIGNLTNLQELEEFRIGQSKGHRISELRNMNEISGHLLLTNLQNVASKNKAATCHLAKKKFLKSLELNFTYKEDDCSRFNSRVENLWVFSKKKKNSRLEMDVLEALKPSASVEILTIKGGRGDSLPGWMWSSANLKCIKVSDFSLTTLPAFGELPSLEYLSFDDLSKLEMIGDEFYGRKDVVFPSLKEIKFSSMSSWRKWSDVSAEKTSFTLLKKITLEKCFYNIEDIGTILKRMPHLTNLDISGESYNVLSISIDCTALRFLEILILKDVEHVHFVGGLKSLVNLRNLELTGCMKILESFEEEEEKLDETCQANRFLTSLNLGYQSCNYIYKSTGLYDRYEYYWTQTLPLTGRLGYLRSLFIMDSPVTEYTEEEGSWFSQLTSLETLEFSWCRELRGLPSTIPLLAKLKKLTITYCPKFSSLPEFGLPPYLTELYISHCSSEIVSRCQPEPHQGHDWRKISHIPHIQIQ